MVFYMFLGKSGEHGAPRKIREIWHIFVNRFPALCGTMFHTINYCRILVNFVNYAERLHAPFTTYENLFNTEYGGSVARPTRRYFLPVLSSRHL